MSVLVKGMKIPENCKECIRSDLRTTIKCTEWTEISAGRRENERAWSCPLVELPEKHGRLVDIDELSHKMYHEAFEFDSDLQKWDGGCWIRYKMFEKNRDAAPTVIEAEGEG